MLFLKMVVEVPAGAASRVDAWDQHQSHPLRHVVPSWDSVRLCSCSWGFLRVVVSEVAHVGAPIDVRLSEIRPKCRFKPVADWPGLGVDGSRIPELPIGVTFAGSSGRIKVAFPNFTRPPRIALGLRFGVLGGLSSSELHHQGGVATDQAPPEGGPRRPPGRQKCTIPLTPSAGIRSIPSGSRRRRLRPHSAP